MSNASKRYATALVIGLLPGMAAQADTVAANFQPVYDGFLADARADCQAFDNGHFEMRGGVDMVADFNGDGVTDPMVDSMGMHCSTSATLFSGGSGGGDINVFVSDGGTYKRFVFMGYSKAVLTFGAGSVLLLAKHGSSCDLSGADACYVAYTWNGGAFHSAGGRVAASR